MFDLNGISRTHKRLFDTDDRRCDAIVGIYPVPPFIAETNWKAEVRMRKRLYMIDKEYYSQQRIYVSTQKVQ